MTPSLLHAGYRRLRQGRVWKLLAANLAPAVLALLDTLFSDEATLRSSVLLERLNGHLNELRADGVTLDRTALEYVQDWLQNGWVSRSLPTGEPEEVFELTAEALQARRWVQSLERPQVATTESRLSTVMTQLGRLAQETNPNPEERRNSLLAERQRIDEAIAALDRDGAVVISDERALERMRDILRLSQEMVADFRSVRDAFDAVNQDLRKRLLDTSGSRGEVLSQVFEDLDLLASTPHGRTFEAFWTLLLQSEQQYSLASSVDDLLSRSFSASLAPAERRFLRGLTNKLVQESSTVQSAQQTFARSLKSMVRSREFREQRRVLDLLTQAQQEALALHESGQPLARLHFEMPLSSAAVKHPSSWALHDADDSEIQCEVGLLDATDMAPEQWLALLLASDIDTAQLERNIEDALNRRPQVSVGFLMSNYEVTQGLGTLIGYISLAHKKAPLTEPPSNHELVMWHGLDGQLRRARIPQLRFYA